MSSPHDAPDDREGSAIEDEALVSQLRSQNHLLLTQVSSRRKSKIEEGGDIEKLDRDLSSGAVTTEDLLIRALEVQKQLEALGPNDSVAAIPTKILRTPSDDRPNRPGPLVSGTAVESYPSGDPVPSPGGMTEAVHPSAGPREHLPHRLLEETDTKVKSRRFQPLPVQRPSAILF